MIMGIDPGKSGAVAVIADEVHYYAFSKYTEHDLCDIMRDWNAKGISMCYLEKVHSMPAFVGGKKRQGIASTFTFGQNFGWYIGVLDALKIPYSFVTPQKWQAFMQCRSGGDKNVTKRRAQQLYPSLKITHAIADALLIATYGFHQHNPFLT